MSRFLTRDDILSMPDDPHASSQDRRDEICRQDEAIVHALASLRTPVFDFIGLPDPDWSRIIIPAFERRQNEVWVGEHTAPSPHASPESSSSRPETGTRPSEPTQRESVRQWLRYWLQKCYEDGSPLTLTSLKRRLRTSLTALRKILDEHSGLYMEERSFYKSKQRK